MGEKGIPVLEVSGNCFLGLVYYRSRIHSLFEDFCTCFNEADVVAIAEVFAAGEDPIEGASRDDLVAGLIRGLFRDSACPISGAKTGRANTFDGALGEAERQKKH